MSLADYTYLADETQNEFQACDQVFLHDWYQDVASIRDRIWANGYRVVQVYNFDTPWLPERSRGKVPVGRCWQHCEHPPPAVRPDALNTGIPTAGLRGFDFDVPDRQRAGELVELAVRRFGRTIQRTRAHTGKTLLLYQAADGTPGKLTQLGANDNRVEVLGNGQQFVADGYHYTGSPLEWHQGAPWDTRRHDLPAVSEADVIAFLAECGPMIGEPPEKVSVRAISPKPNPSATKSYHEKHLEIDDITAALSAIPNLTRDYDDWLRIGMAVFEASGGSSDGFYAWRGWSRQCIAHDEQNCTRQWEKFIRNPPNRITAGTLIWTARQHQQDFISPSLRRPENDRLRRLSGKMRQAAQRTADALANFNPSRSI